MGIELVELEVNVTATADVRGALMMDRLVPVGFQNMTCGKENEGKEGTDSKQERLQTAAKACCVVQQTPSRPLPLKRHLFL